MSATITETDAVVIPRRARGLSIIGILLLGVLVIPFAVKAGLNSYGPLTEDSAIRMAFATIAGQTIAILAGLVAVIVAVKRRHNAVQIAILILIALAIMANAYAASLTAGDLLLSRLDLIAETDLLNK